MNRLALPCLVSLLALAGPAAASPSGHSGHHDNKKETAARPAAATMADGEVRKVDKDTGKVTLKHGEIKNLDMPPMTMVFHVKDRAMLDSVKVGDKVRFAAEQNAGAYTVTAIEPAK